MTLLEKLTMLENEADAFGFKWENPHQIMSQIQSECVEINEHLDSTAPENKIKLQEEIGDLLHAVFSLCVFCKLNPEETLKKSVDKFERRFNAVKSLAQQKGLKTMNGMSFDQLMHFWDQAKHRVG